MKNSVIYKRTCAFGLSALCAASLLAAPARAAELPDASVQPEAAGEPAHPQTNEIEWSADSPVVLTLRPEDGFRMPDVFVVKIDETEFYVRTDGQALPAGITFDAVSGKLTLAAELLHGDCSISVFGAAMGAHVEAELCDLQVKEDLNQDFSAEQPLSLTLCPAEGFALPGELKLILRDILYKVPTDGSNPHEGIIFDPTLGALTISPMHLRAGETVQLKAEAECVDPVLIEQRRLEQEEEERNKRTEIYIRVLPTELPFISFTETASKTQIDPKDGTVLMLMAGQDLALTVEPAAGTMLPEGLKIVIQRENGVRIEEIFRFDGKENAEFLAFDPETQELRILANKLLELDLVIITAATPEELTPPEEEAEDAPESVDLPAVITNPGSGGSASQGTSDEQPQGTPDEQPQGTPDEQPQGTPDEQPQGTPDEQPQGTPEEQPQGTPEEQPQGTPEEQPQGTPEEQPQGTPEEQTQSTPDEQTP